MMDVRHSGNAAVAKHATIKIREHETHSLVIKGLPRRWQRRFDDDDADDDRRPTAMMPLILTF